MCWKTVLEPPTTILLHSNDGVFERITRINWLEPSEEDPLVYTVGNGHNNNPPQSILDIATVVQDGEKYS